ncbi:MFS superfamily sulfate permease-like transporter [Mycolicibacterium sp. BK556]|uniref:SulP family inorganic anion transporter n=1 Tax=Mycobacteriaceae TaxID=1762 RepID=UPI0010E2A2CA|nr:SulP family inorganic anion transporter [Mycobacterium sp. BK086]MBB3606191.1 MFS superfamily sulfate permease-like transporter [Mycolicibacterium sp. BK556]MBB3632769.1 MFS superfamily sulfate permease-like transporter [Mycolicibacterium sp. BK607]TDO17908.1 MFS superfamily sulfate permease-like transporter [Mycobacterium sp. BK086]
MPTTAPPIWLAPAIRPYRASWLRADVLAGLSTGAVVIPLAMAYATVANMPVQMGLYTCIIPVLVYAFIGGSRIASVTTSSTVSTLTASTMLAGGVLIGSEDQRGDLITLTLLVGLFLLAARVFRLGMLVDNISDMTLVGIKVAVGLTVMAAQLPKLLGVPPHPHTTGFFKVAWAALSDIPAASLVTVVVSAACLVVLLLLTKFAPRVPGPLVVITIAIAVSAVVALPAHGVALIPTVPSGFPIPEVPRLDRHIVPLVPGALAIAVMAFLETIAVARTSRRAEDHPIEPDRELMALGLAAVAGAFFHSLPPAGGFAQTSVNLRSGARSQISGLVLAVLAVLVAFVVAPVLSLLPQAVLGAVVVVAVTRLVDIGALRRLYLLNPRECFGALGVALIGLAFGLIPAVAVAVAVTLLVVLHVVNSPHVVQVVRHESCAWIEQPENAALVPAEPLVLRCLVPLYAANVRPNIAAIRAATLEADTAPATVVLDLVRQTVLESTVLHILVDLDLELSGSGVRLMITALPERTLRTVRRTEWWQEFEAEGRYQPDLDAAVEAVDKI